MKGNNSRDCNLLNWKLGIFPQYIIYHFNDLKVRNDIINKELKNYKKTEKILYFGTINIRKNNKDEMILVSDYDINSWKKVMSKDNLKKIENQNFNEFIELNKKIFQEKKTIFTVCYHYNTVNVHYVSFVYDPKEKELISFDPGVDVYPEGQKEIVPALTKAFRKAKLLKKTEELGKTCNKHRYLFRNEPIGIQYNSKTKDAFCQSWTLYFLLQQIRQKNIVRKVCRIHPANREIFLFKEFIIPILEKNKKYIEDICKKILYNEFEIYDKDSILNDLILYSKTCKSKICNKKLDKKKRKNITCEINSLK